MSDEIMMNGTKRSYTISKSNVSRNNSKLKDILSSSRHKSEGKRIEPQLANIPIIKQIDNARLLPKYTAILAKSDDGLSMDDLDQLQQDLEKLLSSSAIRIRYLLSEIGEIDRKDDSHNRKAHHKTSMKRKRPDEKPKLKDQKNGMKVVKKHYGLPVNKFIGDTHFHQKIPKVTLPKNDNSDKFWASIEPYCTNVNKDDVGFLDSLIQEFSKEIDIKLPAVGEHYASAWSEEVMNDEQNSAKSSIKKTVSLDKRNGLHTMVETFSMPQTQKPRALIEEKVLSALLKNGDNDVKIAKLKVEQGILSIEDLTKNMPDDEILTEIKKCQQELAMVNKYNIEELSKLKNVVCIELHSNELKEQLENVDKQVLDLYNKKIISRKTAQQEGDEFDKAVSTEQITKEFESQADALLKQQIELN
ncbi:hypothetical protein NQ314_018905 [Rhamnusium bicolor]|uniref:Transcriptional adapter 3 n=1 Tax=Rhamnusium bicolor TaxID=1586634 RepID=A0AAV8WPU5_9CUCU|nr:hypothetical protein NQ314_018905 [Rhamnusium bicolor]